MQIDKSVIKKCMKGDEKKLKELYLHLFDRLMGICMRYKKDRTEAVSSLNIAFVKIIDKLGQYDIEKDLKAWASRLTVNMLIDEYRKEKNRNNFISIHDQQFHERDSSTSQAWIVEEMQAETIRECIKTLPNVTEKVFNMYAIDGYKHREIAEILNISEGTSKWHVSHARILLKDMLKKEDERKSRTYG